MRLSIFILTRNEEKVIKDCLESVKWAEEIILLDGGSTDKTPEIAKEVGARIVEQKGDNYSAWRNQGKDQTKGEWILYVDADERILPLLKNEIQDAIRHKQSLSLRDKPYAAYAIPRRNFLLGKELKHGGWFPDYQLRLFQKKKLKGWVGKLHEHPEVDGEIGKLGNPMVHFQPEKIEPALEKSIKWSEIEADLLFKADHPKIAWWRVLRMGGTTLFDRLIKKRGFLDGTEGFIESVYQAFHTMIIYLRLWEKQTSK